MKMSGGFFLSSLVAFLLVVVLPWHTAAGQASESQIALSIGYRDQQAGISPTASRQLRSRARSPLDRRRSSERREAGRTRDRRADACAPGRRLHDRLQRPKQGHPSVRHGSEN